jgi:lysophospholipase L1-like esterase
MELFTKVATPKASFKIDYTSHIAFFGSCFADNISSQFANRKFHTLANPFGTVYNPVSMARQVKAIASGKVFGEEDVFQDARCDRLWHCFDAHSSLSASSREECIEKLNTVTTQAREFLQKADVVFITLGTAFVYFLKSTGDAASNCHRQDPSLFERRMIPVEESARALESIVADLHRIRADIRIVFTVSPLRHMADGAHENSLSKATLQLAINKTGAEYFPSYEIVIDELRDYRFYADDMVHLSKTAEDYIFERMVETYCNERTRGDIAAVEKFLKSANHRIVDVDSPATQEFKKKLASQAAELEKQIPGLSLH